MRKKRTLNISNNKKYYLYCFSPGRTEFEYFRKYINEKLNNKIIGAVLDNLNLLKFKYETQ